MEKLKGIKLQRGQKILVIFIAAFVLAALIFAIVFGAIMAVRRAMAVVKYESVNIDEKTTAYLISYYKSRKISVHNTAFINQNEFPYLSCNLPYKPRKIASTRHRRHGGTNSNGIRFFLAEHIQSRFQICNRKDPKRIP